MGRNADALAGLRALLEKLPLNTPAKKAVAEQTAELALEMGDRAYVISLLKPIEKNDSKECTAKILLARAYAENGQSAERDAEINAIIALHNKNPKSPAGKLDMFLLERHKLKDGGSVGIAYVLRPFGPHNTHLWVEIYGATGGQVLHIELNSDDGDQGYFKETHPELVAKGDRRFSLDLFGQDQTLPNGKVDHPHELIQFFEGAPSYDIVREQILTVAKHSDQAQRLLRGESP